MPHFFSDDSCPRSARPPRRPSIIAFISSKALSGPPKPASASATIGASQCRRALSLAVPVPVSVAVGVAILGGSLGGLLERFGVLDLVGAQQRLVQTAHGLRHAVRPDRGSGPDTSDPRGSRRRRPASR
jgi:hypothetical protein